MITFVYKYQTKIGVKKGELDADSIEHAEAILKRQRITPLSIKKKPKDLFGGKGPKPQIKDTVVFVRQFSVMIDAGLPLVQCLDILGNQTENKLLGRTLIDVKSRLEQGETFAEALRRHPDIFDTLFCNMVEAGEAGGILDVIFNRLAAYIEKAAALRGKVKSAMVYPASIMVIAGIVVTGLLVFIIPQFAGMFAEMGGRKLPVITLTVVFLSDLMIHNWYIFLGIPVAGFYVFKKVYATEKGRMAIDRILLKLPVVGDLVQKVSVSKFCRTMGTLIASGVSIIEGLEITGKTAGNKVIETSILGLIDDIKQGKGLADPLRDQGVFPPMVVSMIAVGEETGALDTMMGKIADFYELEVDEAVDALTSMMEPALMAFLGVVVGYVVIAMYMPIFQMGSGA